jgi:hypothetical protein
VGIPLAATCHTAIQTAAEPVDSLVVTQIHFVLGMLVGSIVLGPAYALQALSAWALDRRGVGRGWRMGVGGALQALLVTAWAAVVGIEPSLAGRFPMTVPMILAGLSVGVVVGAIGVPETRRPASSR